MRIAAIYLYLSLHGILVDYPTARAAAHIGFRTKGFFLFMPKRNAHLNAVFSFPSPS